MINPFKIYKNCGLLSLFRQLNYVLGDKIKFYNDDKFDHRFKTSVNNFIDAKDLFDNKNFHSYKATNEYFFDTLLNLVLKYFKINVNETSLIDLGSGKGKVLLMSLKFNFHKIIGIEYSEQLYEDSLNNILTFSKNQKKYKTTNIEVFNIDASLFNYDNKNPTIYFIYNSFSKEIRMQVLQKIKNQYNINKTRAVVIFYMPLGELILDDLSGFEEMKQVDKCCMLNFQVYYFSEKVY